MTVNEILKASFTEDGFNSICKSVFKGCYNEENTNLKVKDIFSDYVKSFVRIGRYGDINGKEIDMLVVYLNNGNASIDARWIQRSIVKVYLMDKRINSAFCAFVNKNTDNWRVSFVEVEYNFDEETNNTKKTITPVKRYSYLVGPNENCNTAIQQVEKIVKIKHPTVDNIKEIFAVEKVTKVFYKEYKNLYDKVVEDMTGIVKKDSVIKNEFKKCGIEVNEFVKRFMGQSVFLYFLQKKGWLGVEKGGKWGTGSKTFIRYMFDDCIEEGKNFFNDKLEHLFYDALAKERKDAEQFYDKLNCRIPYLNGGLFEPYKGYDWVKTDIDIDNNIFSNSDKTGILDMFDRFNFTVKEDDPADVELAVDPEMMGMIFENLLGENERGAKGTFYTPKEVVHYMCRESIVEHLCSKFSTIKREDIENFVKNANQIKDDGKKCKIAKSIEEKAELIDEELVLVKVIDPACGSGAFLMGALIEIVNLRMALNNYIGDGKRTNYELKKLVLKNCIYGTDIDRSAIDIARLRMWLALVVDHPETEKPDTLPNLDYKIMCADALNSFRDGLQIGWNDKDDKKYMKLKDKFYSSHGDKKKEIQKQIEEIRGEFDYKVDFNETFPGFDIVIGNPPYGAKIEWTKDMGTIERRYKSMITANGLKGSSNSYSLFIDLGVNHLCNPDGAVLSYIIPMSFTASKSMGQLHNMLYKKCGKIKMSSYSDGPNPVFESAEVSVSIVMCKVNKNKNKECLTTKNNKRYNNQSVQNVLDNLEFVNSIDCVDANGGRIAKIGDETGLGILKKIKRIKTKVEDYKDVNGMPVYYRSSGNRYYNIITNYSTISVAEKSFDVDKKYRNLFGAILSSNMYFWWYQTYSDGLNMNYELFNFPIDVKKFNIDKIKKIESIYADYLKDIEKNAEIRITVRNNKKANEKNYKIGKSKKYIDMIDGEIADAYGLTKDEIEYIINYDIKFRGCGK